MTVLGYDGSDSEVENLRAWVTTHVEAHKPDFGVPKAQPVLLRVVVRAPGTMPAVINHGWRVASGVGNFLGRDARVDVHNIVVDAAPATSTIAEQQTIELLPWPVPAADLDGAQRAAVRDVLLDQGLLNATMAHATGLQRRLAEVGLTIVPLESADA